MPGPADHEHPLALPPPGGPRPCAEVSTSPWPGTPTFSSAASISLDRQVRVVGHEQHPVAGGAQAGDGVGRAGDGALGQPDHAVEVADDGRGVGRGAAHGAGCCHAGMAPWARAPLRTLRRPPLRHDQGPPGRGRGAALRRARRGASAQRYADRHDRNIVRIDVPARAEGPGRYQQAAAAARTLAGGRHPRRPTPRRPSRSTAWPSPTRPAGRARPSGSSARWRSWPTGSTPATASVLPHERTTPKATTDRLDLTRATEANLSPIWGLSLATGLTELLPSPASRSARVVDDDGVVHRVERVDDPAPPGRHRSRRRRPARCSSPTGTTATA